MGEREACLLTTVRGEKLIGETDGQSTVLRRETDWRGTDADRHIDDQIDAAYRTKYRRYAAGLISHIMSPEARSATFKLVLRS